MIRIILILLFLWSSAFAGSGTWQISQSTDDGRTLGGAWSSSGTSDYFGNQNIFGVCDSAIKFNTTVPQGVTITTAYLSLNITSVHSGMLGTCYGIDEDNTATFSADPFSRDHTTANIPCSYANWSATSGWSNSDSIVSIVQEIINRPGFGGAIGFFLEDNSSPSANVLNYITYDYGGGASEFAPKLYIQWFTPGTPSGQFSVGQ